MEITMSDTRRFGIEEEFFVVDSETKAVMRRMPNGFFNAAKERLGDRVKSEMLQSQIELTSSVHSTVPAARNELQAMRGTLGEVAADHGLAILASGTHPTAMWATQRASETPRYDNVMHDLQMLGQRNIVCGLHVHAEFDDLSRRVDVMGRIMPFIPLIVALSTSSPFWQSRATGLMGYRLAAYDELPRTGLPELFKSQAEYDDYIALLVEARIIEDSSYVWWAVRPSRRFPTLELRAPDCCTHLEDSLAIAALYRSLVRHLLRNPDLNATLSPVSRAVAQENKWRAQRYGIHGSFVDEARRTTIAVRDLVQELIGELAEDAEALECTDDLARCLEICDRGTSADGQLTVWKSALGLAETPHDALRAVKTWIAHETLQ
jgi:carboxylate-amine ligase